MFTMSASWIITATTLFRVIAVMSPIKARVIMTRRLAYYTLFTIYIFSLISILPIYFSLSTITKCTKDGKTKFESIQISPYTFMIELYTPGNYFFIFLVINLTLFTPVLHKSKI